jgi:EAL domain-containing protein (putative c-di-GMP-specific phosphodiesterase class I)
MATYTSRSDTAAGVMRSGALQMLYQPIVDLAGQDVIGYEALARGPVGSPLESPAELFGAAHREGILAVFDRACREQALAEAPECGLGADDLLFLNVEPAGLEKEGILDRIGEDGLGRVSVVVELTERALAARPSEVLAAVRWLRERGCRIALDDVGVDPRSLGLMPFVAPDVIKIDRYLTQGRLPEALGARVINAIRAESERSGAVILAEGIETEAHLRRAFAMGAKLGQGWLFGRPAPLDPGEIERAGRRKEGRRAPLPRRGADEHDERTPFERIADPSSVLIGDKRLLLSLSRQLEQEAFAVQGEAVVLATFQDARFFGDGMRRRYERIASKAALVGALGVGVPPRPGQGIKGADLVDDDRLQGEWDVVVVGPHFAGAFVARDLGDAGAADKDRRFEYFMTYDRARVTSAARALLRHLIRDH